MRLSITPQAHNGVLLQGGTFVCRKDTRDEAYMLDLIANADRRARIEGKYEDAVVRLYSALERGAKFHLQRQYAISTEDVKPARQPEALRDEYVQK